MLTAEEIQALQEEAASLRKEKEALLAKNQELLGEKKKVQETVKKFGEATPEEIEALRATVAASKARELELKGSYEEAVKLREAEAMRKAEHEEELRKQTQVELEAIRGKLTKREKQDAVLALLREGETQAVKPTQVYKLIEDQLSVEDGKVFVRTDKGPLAIEAYLEEMRVSDPNLFVAPKKAGFGTPIGTHNQEVNARKEGQRLVLPQGADAAELARLEDLDTRLGRIFGEKPS